MNRIKNLTFLTLTLVLMVGCNSVKQFWDENMNQSTNAPTTLPAGSAAADIQSQPDQFGNLELVASFPHQATGVAVSNDGRIFVNFPRWSEDAPISVAEVNKDGSLKPYPDEEWNSWRNSNSKLNPAKHFVSVQSVVSDDSGSLWALDPASPNMEHIIPKGPKLVRIDLDTNKVTKVIPFNEKIALQGSYLNDARFSPDGRYAYITDSGTKGAIVVVNLKSGKSRRVLDGDPSTQVEKDVVIKTDGKELRQPDGRAPQFAADGIALSPDGKYLYWQALTGRTLYRLETAHLNNTKLSAKSLAGKVEKIGDNGVADGLLFDRTGKLYVTSPEDNAVKLRAGDNDPVMVAQSPKLRWPDSLAEGPDGAIYVTASHIQDSANFKPDAPQQLPTELWRFMPAK